MSMRCLFVSTEHWDIESAIIDWYTRTKIASHAGWIDPETMWTYSAMADGKGLDWRPPNPKAKVTMLTAPNSEQSCILALADRGAKYDFLQIAGIAANRDWSRPQEWICDKAVFWFQKVAGCPLLNHELYPIEFLVPDDILKSPYVAAHQ
jgi:hypothetical protein